METTTMNDDMTLQMPPLILLEDYDGNFEQYLEAVYAIFKRDFINSKPTWEGKRVALKKFPMEFGKEHTFYHITHEGHDEETRIPDFRRMERIAFSRVMIDNYAHPQLKVWEKRINNSNRIHILNEEERFLVVLEKRQDYFLLWTAFYIEYDHALRKKLKEYEEYIKSKGRT